MDNLKMLVGIAGFEPAPEKSAVLPVRRYPNVRRQNLGNSLAAVMKGDFMKSGSCRMACG